MPSHLLSIAHLLLAVALLEIGSGLQGVLIPMRAHLEGFPTYVLGLLGTSYYLGFVIGCAANPSLIRRVGHIRAFSGFAAILASAFLVHQLVVDVPVWLALRIGAGICFAGIYMSTESWLNERATSETRGRVLAAYMIVTWCAIVAGKLVFAATDPEGFRPFALVSLGICLAVVPVAFTTGTAPVPEPTGRLRFRELYTLSPIALVGALCVGAANGAFWSLAPIHAAAHGLSTAEIGVFVSAAVLGGALAQWPVGWISDRADRRWVIASACFAAALAGAALVLLDAAENAALVAVALIFGAAALPIYSLCVAHANDQAPPDSFIEVSSDLLTMFGIGAVAGPVLAASLMSAAGPMGLYLFTGTIHLVLGVHAAKRAWRQPPVPREEKAPSVPAAPSATQAILPLDPRAIAAESAPAPSG